MVNSLAKSALPSGIFLLRAKRGRVLQFITLGNFRFKENQRKRRLNIRVYTDSPPDEHVERLKPVVSPFTKISFYKNFFARFGISSLVPPSKSVRNGTVFPEEEAGEGDGIMEKTGATIFHPGTKERESAK